jgi:hypothetical protein
LQAILGLPFEENKPMNLELKVLADEFFKTYGYRSNTVSSNGVLYSRPSGLGVADELLVYFHSKGEGSDLDEKLGELAGKFEKIPSGLQGRRFCLSDEPLAGTTLKLFRNWAVGFIDWLDV